MPSFLTRRAFLERTVVAAAATAIVPRLLADAQASGMWISLNGAVAPRAAAWPYTAQLASRIGYGGIDYNLASFRTMGVDASKALLAELKLRPTICGNPVSLRAADAAFETSLAALDETAAFIAAIGGTRVMEVMAATTPGGVPMSEYRPLYLERLKKVAAVLARHNIRIGLEFLGPQCMHLGNCGGNASGAGGRAGGAAAAGAVPAAPATPPAPPVPFLYTLNDTVKLAAEAGPNVGAILDVWHWHHSGSTAADIVAAGASRIVHVHLSDAKAMPPADVRDNMRLMPGEGVIDYAAFFGALKQIGYAGGVAPEPLGRIPMDMSTEDAAKLGYDTTLAVMKRHGVA